MKQYWLLLPLSLHLIHPLSVSAAVYQWVDENGVKIYSQTPPPSGEANQITTQNASDDSEAKRKLLDLRQQAADLHEDRKLKKEALTKEKEETQHKKRNCVAARKNLTGLQGLGRRLYGGKRLTEEERQQKITEARQRIEKNCSK